MKTYQTGSSRQQKALCTNSCPNFESTLSNKCQNNATNRNIHWYFKSPQRYTVTLFLSIYGLKPNSAFRYCGHTIYNTHETRSITVRRYFNPVATVKSSSEVSAIICWKSYNDISRIGSNHI